MNGYVVDASLVVEYLLKTNLGHAVTHILEQNALAAPESMNIESLSAFRRSVLKGKMSESVAVDAIHTLSTWDIRRIRHRELLLDTWTHFRNVWAYDSVYLATAKRLDLEVLNADAKFASAPRIDVAIYNVRDTNVLAQLESR